MCINISNNKQRLVVAVEVRDRCVVTSAAAATWRNVDVVEVQLLAIGHRKRNASKANQMAIRRQQMRPSNRDPNGSCLFAAGSPTDTVGSENFLYSPNCLFGSRAADAGNATPTFGFSVPAISKLTTLTVESVWTAPTETPHLGD